MVKQRSETENRLRVNKAQRLRFRQVRTSTRIAVLCVFAMQCVKLCSSLQNDGSYFISVVLISAPSLLSADGFFY